nr:Hsp33 family molecular chaperone HslO [Akkermansiaceae bacterium]
MLAIRSIFIRRRNALLLEGQFTDLYTDYYLHLADHSLRYPPVLDQMLKDAMAVLTLHLTARPWDETIAWTANLRAPRANLFVTGSSLEQAVAGRVFTSDVREPDRNYFYSQTSTNHSREPRLSTMEVATNDPVDWVERYYERSEQRPCRCFRLPDEQFVLITAQPDCDLAWLGGLDADAAAAITRDEETRLLETRQFRFRCGCTLERILPILGGWRGKLDELFQGEAELAIQCPRCAARYA